MHVRYKNDCQHLNYRQSFFQKANMVKLNKLSWKGMSEMRQCINCKNKIKWSKLYKLIIWGSTKFPVHCDHCGESNQLTTSSKVMVLSSAFIIFVAVYFFDLGRYITSSLSSTVYTSTIMINFFIGYLLFALFSLILPFVVKLKSY